MSIKVYSTSTCSRCKVIKTMLTNMGVHFEEVDLVYVQNNDPDTYNRLTKEAADLGETSLPIITKDEKVITLEEARLCK